MLLVVSAILIVFFFWSPGRISEIRRPVGGLKDALNSSIAVEDAVTSGSKTYVTLKSSGTVVVPQSDLAFFVDGERRTYMCPLTFPANGIVKCTSVSSADMCAAGHEMRIQMPDAEQIVTCR